jgi:hypothetical protein
MEDIKFNVWQEQMIKGTVIPADTKLIKIDTVSFTWQCSNYDIYLTTDVNKKFGYVNINNVFEFIQSIRNKCEDKLFNYLLLNDSNTWVDEIWLKQEDKNSFSVWTKNFKRQLDISNGIINLFNWDFNKNTYDTSFISS